MIGCEYALKTIRNWLLVALGREKKVRTEDINTAFNHIQGCANHRCSQVQRRFNGIITSIEKGGGGNVLD